MRQPIIFRYDKPGAGLVAMEFEPVPISPRVINQQTGAVVAFDTENWADFKIPLLDPLGKQVFLGQPVDVPGLDFVPMVLFFERQMDGETLAASDPSDPCVGVGNAEGVNVAQLAGSQGAAVSLAAATETQVTGAVVSGTNTVARMATDITNPVVGAYKGRSILFKSGDIENCATVITGYDGAGNFTFETLPAAPVIGTPFVIV